jgi:hypothetical protein
MSLKLRLSLLSLSIILSICSVMVEAADSTDKSVSKDKKETIDQEKKTENEEGEGHLGDQPVVTSKRIGVDQSDFMPEENNFGLIGSYVLTFNELEEVERKTVLHRFSLAGTYSFSSQLSGYVVMNMAHESYQNKIFRENDSDPYHTISDFNFGVIYTSVNPLKFIRRSSTTLNLALPVGERSRVDRQIGSVAITNFLQGNSWKGFFIFNRFNSQYVQQSQRFSLFEEDTLNRDLLISESIGLTYLPSSYIGVRWSVRADLLRYLDQSWDLSFGNNISLFSNFSGFQIFASLINNSYPENERIDVSYYDRFRRIYMMGVTYVF